jgi:hypothetical protein
MAFWTIFIAAAFAWCQLIGFFSTDLASIFFLAHKAPHIMLKLEILYHRE